LPGKAATHGVAAARPGNPSCEDDGCAGTRTSSRSLRKLDCFARA
jgi:hypothetical protein